MSRLVFLFALFSCCCFPVESRAWNSAGHMTVARIAWDSLSAAEKDGVLSILRRHPHLEQLLKKDRPVEATEDEWIFLRASIWADDVRAPKSLMPEEVAAHPIYKFHRGNWHYVNFAYKVGQKSAELPKHELSSATNVLKQLDQTMDVLTRRSSADEGQVAGIGEEENRAVRMTWLFHLVGDLHQPLHTVALVDPKLFPDFPNNDQGGNKLAIRADATSMPKNLHWLWDEMFSTDSQFTQILQHAERLTHDPGLAQDKLTELQSHPDFRLWAAESYADAKNYVYLDGQLKLVLWDGVNQNQTPAKDVPVLPAAALEQARQVAQRRIALAGHRLASKLKEIVSK